MHRARPVCTQLLRRPTRVPQPPPRCSLSRRTVSASQGPRSLIFMVCTVLLALFTLPQHGLGDIGESWRGVLEDLLPGWRLQTPTAPIRAVTINGGARMPAWYDITGFDRNALEDHAGTEESRKRLAAMIDAAGVPSTSVFIGGFSQGGAMALWTGLQSERPLGGVLSLSGYLPFATRFVPSVANAATSCFVGHGTDDEVVGIEWCRGTVKALRAKGVANIELHEYPDVGHTVSDDELQHVLAFLQPATATKPRI